MRTLAPFGKCGRARSLVKPGELRAYSQIDQRSRAGRKIPIGCRAKEIAVILIFALQLIPIIFFGQISLSRLFSVGEKQTARIQIKCLDFP